ncbi:MAG: zinc ribbon domain-containing protein [Lachnospiraceae bacterium]|nr:zinc ribbon domain-containing protein [Lachnospiraceae bacterium]
MICPRCGTMNQNGTRFCVSCGNPLAQGQPGGGPGQYRPGGMQPQRSGMPQFAGINFQDPLLWGYLGGSLLFLISIFLPAVSGFGLSLSLVDIASQAGSAFIWLIPLAAAIASIVFFFLNKNLISLICSISSFTWVFWFFFNVLDLSRGTGLSIGFYLWFLSAAAVFGCNIIKFIQSRK